MEKIAIVIINYNGEKDTRECLRSLEKLKTPDNAEFFAIVVDNASKEKLKVQSFDKTQDKSEKFKIDLEILRSEVNLGFSGGNNLGIKYALEHGADYILILNNDTVVDSKLIHELLKRAKLKPTIGIVVPKIYFEKGYEFHKDRYKESEKGKVIWYAGGILDWKNLIGHHKGVDEVDTGQYDVSLPTDYATGCCMFIKKEILDKVGLFDEKYFLYYEDSDFSEKVKWAGYSIVYEPKAILWHKNAQSTYGSGSSLQDYYITRNRLLFGLRFAPLRTQLSLLKESIRLLFFGRNWQRKGVKDFYIGRFGKGSFPLDH